MQSTSLSRGKTVCQCLVSSRLIFQSTSLSRGKTPITFRLLELIRLSIHFPLTREDKAAKICLRLLRTFNPLPSHEGRPMKQKMEARVASFNPLPSHEGRQQKALIFPSKTALFSGTSYKHITSDKIAFLFTALFAR